MLWSTSPACTEVKSAVMDWLADLLGLPATWKTTGPGGGVIQMSASDSTHTALVVARRRAAARGTAERMVAYADGDGFIDEMTRADVTAVSLFQAQLAVPGRMIPREPTIEQAVFDGEGVFAAIGCASCHVPRLELRDPTFVEPNPFNPPGNLQPGEAPDLAVDLTDHRLELPRLPAGPPTGTVWVPAYTDLKLHDITHGPDDPNREPLDMHHPPGSPEFFAGNSRFLTRKLWGFANEPPFFHHGQFTTMREAIEAHHGDALEQRQAWEELSDYERNAVIEFLKTLKVLPPGTRHRIVDEHGRPRRWDSPLGDGT